MRVLVCGGRNYGNRIRVYQILDELLARHPNLMLIQGGARGADRLAKEWAMSRKVPNEEYPADWNKYGKAAGYRRNVVMADQLDPATDFVVAFPGGVGTQHMVNIAEGRLLQVIVVNP